MTTNNRKKQSFQSFRKDFMVLLEEGFRSAGRVTKREFDRASEKIKDRLEEKYGKEKVEEFTQRIKADWRQIADSIQQAGSKLDAEDSFRKGKEIGVQILENLAAAIKKAAESLEASLADKVTYHSGQVVSKGVYFCLDCRKIQEVKRRRKLSACKECGGSEFRMA